MIKALNVTGPPSHSSHCPISLMLMQEALAVKGAGARNKRSSGRQGCYLRVPLPQVPLVCLCRVAFLNSNAPLKRRGWLWSDEIIVVWRTPFGYYCSLWFMVANGFLQPSTWINGLNALNVYVKLTVKRKTDRIHLYKYIDSMCSTVHKINCLLWKGMVVPGTVRCTSRTLKCLWTLYSQSRRFSIYIA